MMLGFRGEPWAGLCPYWPSGVQDPLVSPLLEEESTHTVFLQKIKLNHNAKFLFCYPRMVSALPYGCKEEPGIQTLISF